MQLETAQRRPAPPRVIGPPTRLERPRGIIGIPPRSLYSDVDEGRAIASAIQAAAGNVPAIPVVFGGRIIGFAKGESPFSDVVYFKKVPAEYRMAWSNYNDVIVSLGASQRLSRMWAKNPTSALTTGGWYDLWPVTGIPTAGSLGGAANTAIAYDDTSTGAFFLGGNVAPSIKTLTSTWVSTSITTATPTFLIYDRVLDYQSNAYTAGVLQAMTNVAVAGRYASAGQPGLQMTWATDTVHNATAANISALTYVDNTGAAAAMPTTPTVVVAVGFGAAPTTTFGSTILAPANAAATFSRGAFLPLQAGTTGSREVTDYTTSAANTGTFVLALVYPLAYVTAPLGTTAYVDQVFQIPAMERVYDGAAIGFMMWSTTTTGFTAQGVIDVAWG